MLTRRQLMRRSASAAAVAVLAPGAARAAPLRGGRFAQGVLSGDPTPHGITLLTVLDEAERAGTVQLEVARDPGFRHVVARRAIATSAASGHSVKARLEGLRPHERYWYRFETRGVHSPAGRFQTALPADSRAPVRFAFFSCADFTHGYYNAYDAMLREDVDFVVNLGDYIYAESGHSRAGGTGVRDDPTGSPDVPGGRLAAHTLADYRAKYALYRTDPALRRLHAALPMISIWDDHEVENDYAGAPDGGGLPPAKHYSQRRRDAAYRAFFEAMPFVPSGRSRIYRALRFGRTVDLVMLDQRQYRADQPCGDAVVAPCEGYDGPRDFLGRPQMAWLKRRLASSPAAWKVIGNETLAMPARLPGGALLRYDSWQGYPAEREELLAHLRDRAIRDVVFVTGDIHTFLAGDVRTAHGDGETVALEFAGGSITSANFGEADLDLGDGTRLHGDDQAPGIPAAVAEALRASNPWIDQADFDHHGYGVVRATQRSFDCALRRVATIKARTGDVLPDDGFRYAVARGQTSIKGVNGPA